MGERLMCTLCPWARFQANNRLLTLGAPPATDVVVEGSQGLDQSEASTWVTWPVLTNQRPVHESRDQVTGHVTWLDLTSWLVGAWVTVIQGRGWLICTVAVQNCTQWSVLYNHIGCKGGTTTEVVSNSWRLEEFIPLCKVDFYSKLKQAGSS